jgi:hypothetical protein
VRPVALAPEDASTSAVAGRILCQDIVAVGEEGRVKLGKGTILEPEHALALSNYSHEIHLLELEPGDVHEDEASLRLARAVSGPGIQLKGPVESQTHLRAEYRGLLEVKADALYKLNVLPDVSVFTAYDAQPVTEGKAVGATKVTPLAIPGAVLDRAEEIARAEGPIVQVRPFTGGAVGVVVRDRFAGTTREKFESAIHMKVGWFGSPVAAICYLPDDVGAIAEAIERFVIDGVSLILAAGVNSTDPLDLTLQALDRVGGETEVRGVPAHPGSTCWLAYIGEVPLFGLALCGMFSKTTVLDLLLPRFLSGRSVRAADIAALGHGGLLGRDMAFRFPPYQTEGP